jgi:hypothetical protein
MRSVHSTSLHAGRFDTRDGHVAPQAIGESGEARTVAASARVDLTRLMPIFARLVEETVAQVRACPAKPDPTFEGFEELLAPIRSATTLEGTLLERGIAAVSHCRDDLVVVPLESPLPVLPEARAFLRRNDWGKASALRLASEVHTREFYRPDLLVVDARDHRALILDIKRSIASHKPKALTELRSRMMAAALVARDWLERECDAPAVERVEIAIIDGSGDPAEHEKAIFAIADLDRLLGIEGAGEAIGALRQLYAGRIREILLPRCRRIAGVAFGSSDHGHGPTVGSTGVAVGGDRFSGAGRTFDGNGGAAEGANLTSGSSGFALRGDRFSSTDAGVGHDDDGTADEAGSAAAGIGKAGANALRYDPRVSVGIASLGGRS